MDDRGANQGGTAFEWPRWLAIFAGAMTLRLVTQVPLWAYERGAFGPRDPGQRILLGGPLPVVRLLRSAATVVAVYSGGTMFYEARRRWLAHIEGMRVLAPLPQRSRD